MGMMPSQAPPMPPASIGPGEGAIAVLLVEFIPKLPRQGTGD